MQAELKPVKRVVTDLVPIGYYLVTFEAVWGSYCNEGKHDDCLEHGCLDNEPSYVAEVDSEVNKVTEENYLTIGAIGMTLETNTKENHGDTHDLRARLFRTKREAVAHKEYTLNRFKNPQPWESFVKLA